MDLLSSLNPEQQAAVLKTDGPLLILAGAGSGKTRVIAHRIAYLVSERLSEPDRILAVTFTNKAAEEMRGRVSQALLGVDCRQMWVSTFHALCARLLRREAPHIGLSRDFVIYDSTDQLTVVKQALKSLGIDDGVTQPRAALSRISHAKNRMEGPAVFSDASWNPREQQIAKLYELYTKALKDANALDFDDLLLKTVELFEKSELVRERYSRKFRYVMVDEYQDTNRPQYLLIQRLAAIHRNLCVVGDPDQSIYKWRGADLRNILDFEHDFPEATIVKLERNYRSTQVILDAATAVISQNRNRKEKRLYTDLAGGARIRCYRAGDDLDEAEFIARTARTALHDDHEGSVAILYRTNAQSRTIEDALRRNGTAYKIIGGVRFYERKEVKDALAYLKLILSPQDDVSLRRVINVPARGIGKGVMESLEAVEIPPDTDAATPLLAGLRPSAVSGTSLWARLLHAVDRRLLAPRALASLTAFRDLITGMTAMAAAGDGLDRAGQGPRPERLHPGSARRAQRGSRGSHREPDGAGVSRAGVREPAPGADAGWLRRPVVSSVRCRRGSRNTDRTRADDDDAQRQGAGVSRGRDQRTRGRTLSSLSSQRGRSRSRRGAPPVLCGHHARAAPAGADVGRATPRVWRLSVHGALALHRRGPRRVDRGDSVILRDAPALVLEFPHAGQYGRNGGLSRTSRARSSPTYDYENEDQSVPGGLRPGLQVRHAQFGLGTIRLRGAAQRRHQARRALQLGWAEDASREVREAGTCRRPVMIQRSAGV